MTKLERSFWAVVEPEIYGASMRQTADGSCKQAVNKSSIPKTSKNIMILQNGQKLWDQVTVSGELATI